MQNKTLVRVIANEILRSQHDRIDIQQDADQRLDQIANDLLPSGSGIDSGTQIDGARSTPERIVLLTSFHHLNDAGYYTGWTQHDVVLRASLVWGLDLRVTGRNRNDIKDYLGELFQYVLTRPVQWNTEREAYEFVEEGE